RGTDRPHWALNVTFCRRYSMSQPIREIFHNLAIIGPGALGFRRARVSERRNVIWGIWSQVALASAGPEAVNFPARCAICASRNLHGVAPGVAQSFVTSHDAGANVLKIH